MNRRGFLSTVLALAAAPATVRADSLMRVVPPKAFILWGDGFHDDTQALQALVSGRPVIRRDIGYTEPGFDGAIGYLGGVYRLNGTILMPALSMTINTIFSEHGVEFVSPKGRIGIGR